MEQIVKRSLFVSISSNALAGMHLAIRTAKYQVMEQDDQRDRLVVTISTNTLQRPAAERESYMREQCGDDQSLYSDVAEAVEWELRLGPFLRKPWMTFACLVSPFEPGAVIEDRFEIIREIGEGGMGVVYEAFDRMRQRRIAIKAAKPGFERFISPELESALGVRHHNTCLVNDIRTARTEYGEIDFLAMEYLDGETLSAHLMANGKLSEPKALEIARQLCSGLSEIHRRGVIHRDLKSDNVILCRDADGSMRAVITDFGLAGFANDSIPVGGTPRYLAPELRRLQAASKDSDIYALGMILYDMTKGVDADVPIPLEDYSTKNNPLSEVAVSGLPKRWARTILRCLNPVPAARPRNASVVLAALEPRRLRYVPLLAIPLLASISLFSSPLISWLHDLIWPPPGVRLVVLPPSGSDATQVTSGGVLEDVADRISNLRSGPRPVIVISPSRATGLHITTPEQAKGAATHALQTQTVREGEEIVVKGALIELETQTHVRDFSYRYSARTVGALAGALTGEVSAGLRLRGLSPPDTLSPAAATRYDQGLYLLQHSQNADQAVQILEEAASLDPRSPLPAAALVEAEIKHFENNKHSVHLSRAQEYLETAESLNPDSVSVHLAAGKLSEITSKREKALEEYLRVRELAPSNIEASLRIAGVYAQMNMPERAMAEYTKAIALDPLFYEPHEHLGVFYYNNGKYSQAAEQFKKVIGLAPNMTRAYINLAGSYENLGRFADAEQVALTAKQLQLTPDDTTPDLMEVLGTVIAAQNRDADALPYYERAEALNPDDYRNLLNLGDSYRRLDRKQDAKRRYQRALAAARSELVLNPENGSTRAFAAYFTARLGQRSAAESEIGQALQFSPGDHRVKVRAVLTYEALGLRVKTLGLLRTVTPEVLQELERDPDLADLCHDPRFRELVTPTTKGTYQNAK